MYSGDNFSQGSFAENEQMSKESVRGRRMTEAGLLLLGSGQEVERRLS